MTFGGLLKLAQPGHAAVVRRRLLLGVERTCRSSGPTSEFDPTETLMRRKMLIASGKLLFSSLDITVLRPSGPSHLETDDRKPRRQDYDPER
jgi:hypothetical protein